ncbi:hypothetical protein GTP23_14220 [Pseudoduganella sp. FT93W]|uniref:Uncharacterized protein n=1 Tax=Duganella fentianensis TaxID=2692177 RepID=A0A845HXT5_9BURK|nr:hypothetical protein [Duganella fentianensis]MYN46204.1 hypothetical protein [Duganella fentianensis]
MKKLMPVMLMVFSLNCFADHGNIRRVYIDRSKNVHIIFSDGLDRKVTNNGHATEATLAPNKRTAAWLVQNSWIADGDVAPGSAKIAIYRDEKLRYISCEPFIRDYWYWMQGEQIAIDCGGRHFSGTQSIYDTSTLLMIDSFVQSNVPENQRPIWSK